MNYYTKEPYIKDIVKNALKEDIGKRDITTQIIVPKNKPVKGIFLAKEDCVICGLNIARLVFKLQDKFIKFNPKACDGESVKKGEVIAIISGKAGSILTAERVALNFLSHLSGISTQTRKFADAVKPKNVKIIDTRKTTPGLRILEKYAVRMGGGFNHRFCLDEMILVKDNHLKIIGGINRLPRIMRKYKLEIEVKDLLEFKAALKFNPDIIMLDNMSLKNMLEAVRIRNNFLPKANLIKPKLEASGGISLKNIRKVASTGVDMISVGALTHSVDSVDISLEIQ